MNKKIFWVLIFVACSSFSGCATMPDNKSLNPDQVVQAFFDDVQRSNNQGAYGLFAQGLSQRVSFDQFDSFMQTLREAWGRIETEDTALLPFHRRVGEENFIPLHVMPKQIKRYTYEVKFSNAQMNFDLTLAPQGDSYRIVWFSIWGSSIYMTPKVQEKIEQLFSTPDNS